MDRRIIAAALLLLAATATALPAQSLDGSEQAMARQRTAAVSAGIPFHKTVTSVYRAIVNGELVPVKLRTSDYRLYMVAFPYARPETVALLEYLARGYVEACDEQLVVTSLTRPESEQPGNASDLSVHPAGLAMDIRHSDLPACREWLERELLGLERDGVVEATRENWPAHYHVAVLPTAIRELWPGRVAAAAQMRLLGSATAP
jgi:hypothetical protein